MQVRIGDVGYRRADGSVYRWEPIRREEPDAADAAGAEDDIARRAAGILAAKFAAYKAAEKKVP